MYGGVKPKKLQDYESRFCTDRTCRNFDLYAMDLAELQYIADADAALKIIKKWQEKSDNEELRLLSESIVRIVFYTNKLELESYCYNRLISEARADKNRAIERARRVEKELETLKKTNYEI